MMNNLLFVIAQTQTNPLMTFLPLVLIMVVFYFFMIRPQMKRQKELQKFRSALQKGDKVVTTGGLYGRIVEIKDSIIFLEIAPNVKVKVDKSVVLKDISDAPQQK
ncbi:preprotein translocase subunit YajC [Prolixibacter bellariivorans]|jgi:preprotein translocase subunit YajC|uniref:Sec translocon accessory complex subunit YajC n=2 Tax=Prolixibacter bellariivorans TaxID=314319 RepID=A0A5M4B296_9BACT|nr:preprotein translocase subunit YajC [Prolixibacter bellariivorans]GET34285.1 preprotein translocase subunit YajC [Prolixibacter bellariivorans]